MQTCVISPPLKEHSLKELCQFVFSQEYRGPSFVCVMLQKVQNKDQELGMI